MSNEVRDRQERRWATESYERGVLWLIIFFVFWAGYVCGGAHTFSGWIGF